METVGGRGGVSSLSYDAPPPFSIHCIQLKAKAQCDQDQQKPSSGNVQLTVQLASRGQSGVLEEGSDLRAISCETALLETVAPLQLLQPLQAAPLTTATPQRRYSCSLSNGSRQQIPLIQAAHKGTNHASACGDRCGRPARFGWRPVDSMSFPILPEKFTAAPPSGIKYSQPHPCLHSDQSFAAHI